MSLMEDVMRDIRKLKDRQDDLNDSLNKLSDKVCTLVIFDIF